MSYDTGDNEAVAEKRKSAKFVRTERQEQMKAVLATKEGRDVIWRILEQTGLYKDAFTGNSSTFYNEGKRAIGLYLIEEMLSADAEAYVKLQMEHLTDGRK